MNKGIISPEFYIGRYIYLQEELSKLPRVTFNHLGSYEAVSIVIYDPQSRKDVRKRITERNPQWEQYRQIAEKRLKLEDQLRKTKASWKSEYRGSLEQIASEYTIIRNDDELYSSDLFDSLVEDSNGFPKDKAVAHDCIQMRSLFETEVAEILDNLGIEYKYEAALNLGGNKPVFPDFSLNLPEYNRCAFIEVLGLLGNVGYVNYNSMKLDKYVNAGLYPNRDFALISGDYNYRPDHDTIKRIIGVLLDALARQYVVRKSRR